MSLQNTPGIAYCIGCACHDYAACESGCHWLRVDYAIARGVCSQCALEAGRWDAGSREMRVPIDDNLSIIAQALQSAWNGSSKGPEASAYVTGMIDLLHWLGELDELERANMFGLLGSEKMVPAVPGWITGN